MRIKHVFNSSEIPHLWVYQKQDNARTPRNNFFFEGKSIYSYGHHFEIARIVKPGVILFTSRDYSNTTASHKSAVYSAIPHSEFRVFTVPNFTHLPDNIIYYTAKLQDIKAKMIKSITGYNYLCGNYVSLYNEFLLYLNTFRLKGKAKQQLKSLLNNFQIADLCNEIKTKRDKAKEKRNSDPNLQAKRDKAKQQREELKLKKELEIVENWRNGKGYIYLSRQLTYDYLRYNAINKTIETSRNVAVSIDLCHRLYNKIKAKEDIKGYKLADFTVIGLNGTLKIGCHNIPISEIDYIANLLKW